MDWLRKLWEQIRTLWGKWTTTQKIVLLGVVGAVLLAIVLIIALSAQPSYRPLIGRAIADPDEQARILSSLDENGITYTVRNDMIYVSDDRTARRARQILLQEDLVSTDVNPWEFFTNVSRWSVTDFERNVAVRRAVTQQIELHIESLDGVDDAKIVVDIPEDRLLQEDQKPITASVIITPSPGSQITTDRKVVMGVERLILKGVSGLTHENLVISDNLGNTLNDFEGMAAIDLAARTDRLLRQRRTLERQYEERVLGTLKAIWPDRVQVNVTIDLDTSQVKTTAREITPIVLRPDNPDTPYDDSQVLQSTPVSTEQSETSFVGTGYTPQGPPGQEGQTPPDYEDMSNLNGQYSQVSQTINYAMNERNSEIEGAPYTIKRITASVALDGVWTWSYDDRGNVVIRPDGSIERVYTPVSAEDLAKAEGIVQDAIGFSRTRGDSVTVENVQFDRAAEHELENGKFRRQIQLRRTLLWIAGGVAGVLFLAIMYRLIAREAERRRRLREEELARQHQAMREAALRSAEEQGVEVELSVEERARLEMQENAVNMAREHPEDVAQLIRTWLMEE